MGSGPTNSGAFPNDWGSALAAAPTPYQPKSLLGNAPAAPAANSGGLTNGPTNAVSPAIASLPNSNVMPQPSGLQTAMSNGGLAQNAPDNSAARTNLINALRAMGLIP